VNAAVDPPELVIVNVSPDCEPVDVNPLIGAENVTVVDPLPLKYVGKL
jgi:hypothetical protein